MAHKRGEIFTNAETNRPKSNTFDLTHDRKFSTQFGDLTPILVLDTVPGDSIKIQPNAMVRMAPMIAPVMHRANVFLHYFFVPNRILWPENVEGSFEDFITGGEDGLDSTVWAHADYKPASGVIGTLPDFMGLPIGDDLVGGGTESLNISPLPFCAYQKIWNDYYRDQNLQAKVRDTCDGGLMDPAVFGLMAYVGMKRRAWQHDYFTSALPWTQKGPEAMLPLGTEAPLVFESTNPAKFLLAGGSTPPTLDDPLKTHLTNAGEFTTDTDASAIAIDITDSTIADLSNATAASINDLRRAFKLQIWLERNARGGSRYNESIKIHFGVNSSDARLQRPEYIGGSKSPLKISEVLQTSNNDTQDTPQGTMAGHGISVSGGSSFTYTCEEHGYIIGIMSILPESAYMQGFPKHFKRQDKFDYYWPEFAHIGEQPIMNYELMFTGNSNYNKAVFGYTPRYAEYKYMNNTVHGDYKKSLLFWHMARKFSSEANLNEDFITMDATEVERIFAVEDIPPLWCHVLNVIKARRLMPVFGTPKL